MRGLTSLKYLLFSGLFVCGLMAALFGREVRSATPPAKNTLVVNVLPLEAQHVDVTTSFVGYITPINSVEMRPNVSGYIDEVWAVGGQHVKAGDNLVLIDQREYKASLDAARSAVAQAQADLSNAQSYYNRLKKAGAKAVSASALDEAKAQFLAADAALKQAKAQEQKAAVLYDYTVLQAPIEGIIGNVTLTKGDYVSPSGNALLSIIQFNPIRVMFALSDKEYLIEAQKHPDGNLFEGESISLKLSDGTLYPLNGQFQFADNHIDKSTGSVSVFADFENKDRLLLSNSYVDVILSKPLLNVFLIRQNYADMTDKGIFVNIMNKGKISQVPLKIAGYYQDCYVSENAFSKDDYLVVDKLGRIAPDTPLQMNILSAVRETK